MEVTETKYHGFSQNNANETKWAECLLNKSANTERLLKGRVTFLLMSMLLELLPDITLMAIVFTQQLCKF